MKNVRLEDIAKELNLTKVSVSKALRDHKDISLNTRKRVKAMAKKMGYHPNMQARSLTSRETMTIGVIIPKIAHTFFAATIEGIYEIAEEKGYRILLGVSREKEELEIENIKAMVNMRVDGLVVSVTEQTKNAKAFDIVRKMGIHLVFFDRGFSDAGYSYIKVEDKESAKKGIKHLIDLGYKEIAHLSGYRTSSIGRERLIGYREALSEAELYMPENAIVEGGFNVHDGTRGYEKLLKEYGDPEAIFAVTYPVGLGILNKMDSLGIDPSKTEILTFGGSVFNRYLSTPFICIDQPNYELGKKAIEKLFQEMEADEEIEPVTIELPANVQSENRKLS